MLINRQHAGRTEEEFQNVLIWKSKCGLQLTPFALSIVQIPYGYFLNLEIKAPGRPLVRIYKEF